MASTPPAKSTNQPHKPTEQPKVMEFLRVDGDYKAAFPTAISKWGPVFAKATRIGTMIAEHLARQEDLKETRAPGFETVGPNSNKRSTAQQHKRTNTDAIISQRQTKLAAADNNQTSINTHNN